jgi:serine/threonine-protein kinase BUR1
VPRVGPRDEPYRDRDRHYADVRHTRSRSPDRERRERLQNRERNLYRR